MLKWILGGAALLVGGVIVYKVVIAPAQQQHAVGGGQKGTQQKQSPPQGDQTAHDWATAVGGAGNAIAAIAKAIGNGQSDDSSDG